jgi:hypothetical protein
MAPGFDVSTYEVILAPPSLLGISIAKVALPKKPIVTEVIEGAMGGPIGRCHKPVN